jgi:NADH-quinone oxidoreductase subunit L
MWVGIIGGGTAIIASLAALNQTDLKKVLAYSTISQLGLMFLASGIGAFYAAMFHLTTHAFMKALLFLSAGNVIHAVHGTTEMDQMGGLAKPLKITHWLFLIGVLAMSGIPPFAAFFSKDLILEAEYLSGHNILFYVAVITSILTAVYLTRAYFLTFRGPSTQNNSKVHEAPSVMLIPVAVLAVLTSIGGFLGFAASGVPFLENYLSELGITHAEHDYMDHFWAKPETWLSIAMAVFGVGLGSLLYTTFRDRLSPPLNVLKKAFYFDEIYNVLIVLPYSAIASLIARGIEPHVMDQMIHLSSAAANNTAYGMQKTQSGQIRSYAAWMVIGGVCLLIYFIS